MGKFTCSIISIIPLLLSALAICALLLPGFALTNKGSGILQSFYFVRANTETFAVTIEKVLDQKIDNTLLSQLENSNLDDFYDIGLWNYCSGDVVNGKDVIKTCSSFSFFFWFNIKKVWAFQGKLQDNFPPELVTGIAIYEKVSRWMALSFLSGAAATVAQLVVGLLMICCITAGSFIAGIIASVSTFLILAFVITVTVFFRTFTILINKYLGGYGVRCDMGRNVYIVLWVAAALSLAAAIIWGLECCLSCFGKLRRKPNPKTGFHPHAYQSIEDADNWHASRKQGVALKPVMVMVPTSTRTHAYEPYSQR